MLICAIVKYSTTVDHTAGIFLSGTRPFENGAGFGFYNKIVPTYFMIVLNRIILAFNKIEIGYY